MSEYDVFLWEQRDGDAWGCRGHVFGLNISSPGPDGVFATATLHGSVVTGRMFSMAWNAQSWLEGVDLTALGKELMETAELEDLLHVSSSADEMDVLDDLTDMIQTCLHAVITDDGDIHAAHDIGSNQALCGQEGEYARYLGRSFKELKDGFCTSCGELIGLFESDWEE